jgi:hypothetical protein
MPTDQADATKPASEEMAALRKEMLGVTLGGDSYPRMLVTRWVGSSGSKPPSGLTLLHHGEFPLRELRVRVHNVTKFREMMAAVVAAGPPTPDDFERARNLTTLDVSIGAMPPGSTATLCDPYEFSMPVQELKASFRALNGYWVQDTCVVEMNGDWPIAQRLVRLDKDAGKTPVELYVSVPPNFPPELVPWTRGGGDPGWIG